MKGFSSKYVRFQTQFNANLVNEFTRVKVTAADNSRCCGEIITGSINQPVGIKNSIDSLAG
jgi:hypothetical protein